MRIAVIGATGLVGRRVLELLGREEYSGWEADAFASQRSAGKEIEAGGATYTVEAAGAGELADRGYDLALIAAGKEVSREFAPELAEAGTAVIDKSRVFRMEPDVPLVVGGVNNKALTTHPGIIANPNCSTIQLVHTLAPLTEFGLERVFVTTYQSVSGAGGEAVQQLHEENRELGEQDDYAQAELDAAGYAGNVIPWVGSPDGGGYASEESKLHEETNKILDLGNFPIDAHACRVPVYVGHSEALTVELAGDPGIDAVRGALQDCEYLKFFPNGEGEQPSPLRAVSHDLVEVGRLRESRGSDAAYSLFNSADNLGVGAALNGLRIARFLKQNHLLGVKPRA